MATFSDTFSGAANASLGANWTQGAEANGGFQLTGTGVVIPEGGTDTSEFVAVATADFTADQEATITYGATDAAGVGAGCGVTCRQATAAITYYRLIGNGGGYELGRLNAGSFASLSSGAGTTFTAADTMTLRVTGTGATVTWTCYKNSVQFVTGTDTSGSRIVAADQPGIAYSSTDIGTTITAFSATDVVVGGGAVKRNNFMMMGLGR